MFMHFNAIDTEGDAPRQDFNRRTHGQSFLEKNASH